MHSLVYKHLLNNIKNFLTLTFLIIKSHLISKNLRYFSFSYFLEFMKATPIILNLNLSHNKIQDKAVDSI